MIRNPQNVVPVTLAVLLHVILFGSLFVAFDFSDRARPVLPLAIRGTLVTDNAIVIPPKVREVVPPEPDVTDQQRIKAEENKRREDARIEQERIDRIQRQEEERRQAEERKRQADAEQRNREAEAEKERKRVEAEQIREAEVERQRLENERVRAEVAAARQAEIDAESNRLNAMMADARTAYAFAIRQRVMSRWVQPPTATKGIECIVNIKQLPGGEVMSVSIGACNGDAAVRRSIENAVYRASPLPSPADPSVFERNLRLEFRPTD